MLRNIFYLTISFLFTCSVFAQVNATIITKDGNSLVIKDIGFMPPATNTIEKNTFWLFVSSSSIEIPISSIRRIVPIKATGNKYYDDYWYVKVELKSGTIKEGDVKLIKIAGQDSDGLNVRYGWGDIVEVLLN